MEPDVVRMYSSSPPPMEDGAEDEEDEFGDFGGFSGVPASISFTEFDTPATFNQTPALVATSPPELLNNRGVVGSSNLSSGQMDRVPMNELSTSNGVEYEGCQEDSPSERTVSAEELKKLAHHTQANNHSNTLDISGSGQIVNIDKILDCNGRVAEVLTNGFATLEMEGSLSLQNSVYSKKKGTTLVTPECAENSPPSSPEDDFADFTAFSDADIQGHPGEVTYSSSKNLDIPSRDERLADNTCQSQEEQSFLEQGMGSKDNVRDTLYIHIRTGSSNIAGSDALSHTAIARDATEGLSDWGFQKDAANSEQRDVEPGFAHDHSALQQICKEGSAPEAVSVEEQVTQNGVDSEHFEEDDVGACGNWVLSSTDGADRDGKQLDEKRGSENETETETETETSFGRPLSMDALEEYGDISTTGSVPTPPLQEEMATPADHSQLLEDDDGEDFGDFGDFGDTGSFSGQGFANFDQQSLQGNLALASQEQGDNEHFDNFDAQNRYIGGRMEDEGKFADFPGSDSFADFSSAPVDAVAEAGWNAFDEPEQDHREDDSWAAFEEKPTAATLETGDDEWQEIEPVAAHPDSNGQISRKDNQSVTLCSRLEKVFLAAFPKTPVPQVGEQMVSLKTLIEPPESLKQEDSEMKGNAPNNGVAGDKLWRQLLDIHEAFGLRHQWGGSHSNKTLLCSLGIDIRNILFTGQKKQPVIVPMYAASLGMLEPTKEPVKPISAAEMIASIAQQAPAVSPVEIVSVSPPDTAQEVLPPIQFDWSSSGLTNPLDASGGSSLLNLDFFGPVEDSGSSGSTSIPGVDPELYELTTAKLDPSGSGSRVADAFARLMSTMEKTSTATRKPRKEENLSEEASKVIAGLPDLSFMQAKVLMFPTMLIPLCSSTDHIND